MYPTGWPTEGGWVSSGFGQRSDPFTGRTAIHEGVDIASRFGSTIKAMGGGVVSYAGDKDGYGCTVEINHGNGYTTRYAHCKSTLVRVGDRVTKGQGVALVGTTGRSTGPHLHFEVLRDGKASQSRFLPAVFVVIAPGAAGLSIQVAALFLHNHAFIGRKPCFWSGRPVCGHHIASGLISFSW